MEKYSYAFKIITVGDSGIGKSSMILRFTTDTYRDNLNLTIGVDFGVRILEIDGIPIKVQVWDTSGQEKFKSITRAYYKGAAGAIVAFDITNYKSFVNVNNWLKDVYEFGSPDIRCILVGTKSDNQLKRQVAIQEIESLIEKYKIPYIETSALNGQNVNYCFFTIAQNILRHQNYEICNNFSSGILKGNYDYKNSNSIDNKNVIKLKQGRYCASFEQTCCGII